jgi:hypothetical protein
LNFLAGLNSFLYRAGDFRGALEVARQAHIVAQAFNDSAGIVMSEWMLGVAQAVLNYTKGALPGVRIVLNAKPTGGASSRSVVCGRHAFDLAEALTAEIKRVRDVHGVRGRIHLFAACPGGFALYLGQQQPVLGAVTLYEYDFEGTNGGSYAPSLAFPI